MREYLFVERFAGLKKVEIQLKPITVLIGPQASGKSILVKLAFYFKNFFSEIIKGLENNESKRELDNHQKEKFLNFFPKEAWGKEKFTIKYEIENSFISIERLTNGNLNFNYSTEIQGLIKYGRKLINEDEVINDPHHRVPRISTLRNIRGKFWEYAKSQFSDRVSFNQFFIPAGRSFFSTIQSSIFSFLSENRSLDPFLIEFGSFYEGFKTFSFDNEDNKKIKKDRIDPLISQIMNGEYLREKDKDFLVHNDSRKVNISNASSGQQETLPLVLVLRTLINSKFQGLGSTLYIEEPEAHLFPTAQKRMIQLLATIYNMEDMPFQFIITTHSPYILASFNNLLEAGALLDKNQSHKRKITKVVPESEILRQKDFSAYSLINGEIQSIMDTQTNLISTNILDSISDEISIEFGKLLEIES